MERLRRSKQMNWEGGVGLCDRSTTLHYVGKSVGAGHCAFSFKPDQYKTSDFDHQCLLSGVSKQRILEAAERVTDADS